MDLKISSCTGFALPVLLLSVALAACGDKTTTTNAAPTAVTLARYNATGAPGTPGTPDTGFGTQGVVMTDVNASQDDIAFAVVLQPDGKIIAVGSSFTAPASIMVIRYNANGTLDSTFGSNGITVTSLPSVDASAFAATLDSSGKLLVAGRSSASSGATGFLLLRYHTNSNLITGTPGTLDAGFGTGGIVTTGIPSGVLNGANAVVLSGTNILVAGHSKIGGKFVIALAQYTSSGVLDTTTGFGGGTGIVTTQIGAGDADVAALAVQPLDGKIVAAGLAGNAVTNVWDVALLRYNTDGTLDLPFGGTNTGMVITDIGSSSNYANAVALQADGKIVVAGNAFANPSANTSDIAVLRYNADGSLDTAGFGSPNGYVTTSVGAFDNGYAVAVQPSDGKIVVAGNADAGVGDRLALLRYNADGGLDSGFGTGGIVTRAASGPSIIAGAFGVALQPSDGAIVVVGYD
ncbi:MAG: hypothetical protein E6H56_05780 [Betaproteobacteria bacterium]|nr:MAG: hypothetical protein E6H56_05780 [Betaproteobacteria bacterium]